MASEEDKLESPLQVPKDALGKENIQISKDISLYYEKVGEGPEILFIHGGPGIPAKAEEGLLKIKGYSLYLYHSRGTGKSTKPVDKFEEDSWMKNPPILEKKLGMSAQIADIERIKRAVGKKKIHIIGLSYGGFIASLFAAEFPDSVEKLILINPAPIVFQAEEDKHNLFARIGKMQETDEQKKAYADYMKRFTNIFGSLWTQDEKSLNKLLSEMGPFYFNAAKKQGMKIPNSIPGEWIGGWNSFALFLSVGRSYDYTGFIHDRVKAKTLLLIGDNDLTPPEVYEPYRKSLHGMKEYVVKGAGHFPHIDKPEEFASAVLQFLKEE